MLPKKGFFISESLGDCSVSCVKMQCLVLQFPLNPKLVVFMLQITMFFLRTEMYSIKKNATNTREMSGTVGNLAFVSAFVLKADFGCVPYLHLSAFS